MEGNQITNIDLSHTWSGSLIQLLSIPNILCILSLDCQKRQGFWKITVTAPFEAICIIAPFGDLRNFGGWLANPAMTTSFGLARAAAIAKYTGLLNLKVLS